MEETLKLLKVDYLSNHFMDQGEIRGKLECGSAQPSLFYIECETKNQPNHNRHIYTNVQHLDGQ